MSVVTLILIFLLAVIASVFISRLLGDKIPLPFIQIAIGAGLSLFGFDKKEVHIRQRKAVPAAGSTLQLMPTENSNSEVHEINYFCLTGEVDESAKNWIRLYSSVMPEEHTGEERIIVEDGKIYIKVLPNIEADSRNGIVHLTTMASSVKTGISNVQRIKIDVTQLGQ